MKKIILFLSLTFNFNLFAQIPSYISTDGLVSWYSFTGNANDLKGSDNGVINGAVLTEDRFGNLNSAYSYDGSSSSIVFSQQFEFHKDQDATLAIWINKNNGSLGQGTILYSTLSQIDSDRFNFYFNDNNKRIDIDYRKPVTLHQLNLSNNFIEKSWQHVVFSRVGNIYKLFINGQFINTVNDTIPNLPTAIGWQLGADPTSIYDFSGKLDDIGIWNRALSEKEIKELYNGNICSQNITVTDTLIINTTITNFNPISYSSMIKIWPNPSKDHITIDYGNFSALAGYQLQIINSLGQKMFQTTINQKSSDIDLLEWSGNGIYFVHIINAEKHTIDIRKIVLQ